MTIRKSSGVCTGGYRPLGSLLLSATNEIQDSVLSINKVDVDITTFFVDSTQGYTMLAFDDDVCDPQS